MRPRAVSPSSSVTSRPTTSRPAWRHTCAIPAPMVPSPTTPTCEISTAGDPMRSAPRPSGSLREEPLPAHLALGLGHHLELVAHDLEAGLLGQAPVRLRPRAGEVHLRAEPLAAPPRVVGAREARE